MSGARSRQDLQDVMTRCEQRLRTVRNKLVAVLGRVPLTAELFYIECDLLDAAHAQEPPVLSWFRWMVIRWI